MSLVATSKYLSLILRHRPEVIGIELDAEGWADVDLLLERAAAHGKRISRADLERAVRESDKQRFALSDDGRRIRARQGHSIPVDLGLEPATPPAVLFHGTTARFVDAILREGLRRQQRHHVHLSADHETAVRVGARRGHPVVFEVDAAGMVAAGHRFYRSENGVWLTDAVPPAYLKRADAPA